MKKISVSEACVGCGACVSIASNLFDFDETGYSYPIKENIENEQDIEDANRAADACPFDAIEVEDASKVEDTKED